MFEISHRVVQFIFAGLALVGAVVGTRQAHGDESERPIISTTIDFLDYCFFRTDPSNGYFTEEQYDEVIRTVAEAGITKIYLRVDVCGVTLYPTKVGKQYAGDGRDPGKQSSSATTTAAIASARATGNSGSNRLSRPSCSSRG